MSISRERFDNASEEELAELSTPDRVLGFLLAHDEAHPTTTDDQ